MEGEVRDFETEIRDWAEIRHIDVVPPRPTRPRGGVYKAYDRETGCEIGFLSYYFIDDKTLQFKDVNVDEKYRRRKVAKALLRTMYLDHPDCRINPGTRSRDGEAFMKHILETEADIVATNGVLNVPLSTMTPEAFRNGWKNFVEAMRR